MSTLAGLATLPTSPKERQIAEYLISVPSARRGALTAEEITAHTGASRSTLDRLARRLGHPGFKSFRRALASSWDDLDRDLDPTILPGDDPHAVTLRILSSVATRMQTFAEVLLADNRLDELVQLLDEANRIIVCGVGLSTVVAMDLNQRFLRLGLDVRYSEDVDTQLAYVAQMNESDIALCVSYSGSTEAIVHAGRIASQRGTAVALTSDPDSLLATACQLTITTPTGVANFGYDAAVTRLLQIALIDVLFNCLALRRPSRQLAVTAINATLEPFKLRVDREQRPTTRGSVDSTDAGTSSR